jgi:hypothetical protein
VKDLPENVRLGDNKDAFLDGFRLWEPGAPARLTASGAQTAPRSASG